MCILVKVGVVWRGQEYIIMIWINWNKREFLRFIYAEDGTSIGEKWTKLGIESV